MLRTYRRLTVHFIPNLKILDDVPISRHEDRMEISEQDIDNAVQNLEEHQIKDMDEYEIVRRHVLHFNLHFIYLTAQCPGHGWD